MNNLTTQLLEYIEKYSITNYNIEIKSDGSIGQIRYTLERDYFSQSGVIYPEMPQLIGKSLEQYLNNTFDRIKNIIRS